MTKLGVNFNNISIANGYTFDINGKVFEWRDVPLGDSEYDCIIYRDPRDYFFEDTETEHILEIEVVHIPSPGNSSPLTLRNRMNDILKAFQLIEEEDDVEGAAYIGSDMQVEHDKKKYMGASMLFRIFYMTDRWEI
jgi:hypothetical protein